MLRVLFSPSGYLAELFLPVKFGYNHYTLCPQHATENQTIMSKEKDVFMVFSCLPWSAAYFWAVQLQIFCIRLQTPQKKNSWEISEAAEQSGYNRKKKKKLIERKLSEAAPWCPFTLRHCPREPPGKLQDIFFPDNNVEKHKSTHGISLCRVALGKRYGETVRFAIALITLCSFLDVKKKIK